MKKKKNADPERVSLDPLDPETALRALMHVDPGAEPVEHEPAEAPEEQERREA
jgi:hypothetical protein